MPVPDGLRLVDNALKEFYCQAANSFHLPRPLSTLEPDASGRASQTGTEFLDCDTSCDVRYRAGHLEITMWHISIMCAEYVAGMLDLKGKDGHCRNHEKPCALTRALHLKMLERFRADLEKLDGEIRAMEAALAPPPPPAPQPAKQSGP